jgi:NAD(P)-dependent dehydrogenase (short-subunit alcohol dehydrogenase family)
MPSNATISVHPAFAEGQVAVITGAASGIGLAAAKRFVAAGMRVVLADLKGDALDRASKEVAGLSSLGPAAVRAVATDVSVLDEVARLKNESLSAFGSVSIVMNNAGIGRPVAGPWQDYDRWRRIIDVNLLGVVHGIQTFVPDMITKNFPALVINTGSKQGITNPPGNVAYNVAKAGVKVLTEQLAHELRTIPNCQVMAHLLIPGSTYTGLSSALQKPTGAWTPDQVVEFMLDGIAAGDFYILCPDNDVTRLMDERRIQWAADDLIKNRPALSRWHPNFRDEFQGFMAN